MEAEPLVIKWSDEAIARLQAQFNTLYKGKVAAKYRAIIIPPVDSTK